MVLIYLITSNEETALQIGETLIQERLANSTNVIPEITTVKWSGDEVVHTSETLLLIKTKALLYSSIEKRVGELMNTEDPSIFSMPMTQINHGYQNLLRSGVMPV